MTGPARSNYSAGLRAGAAAAVVGLVVALAPWSSPEPQTIGDGHSSVPRTAGVPLAVATLVGLAVVGLIIRGVVRRRRRRGVSYSAPELVSLT
jgi:hypothetical protein